MNNIEILEMQLKKIKDFCKDNKNYYPEELPYYMFWNGKQAEIVGNLIQENKELKEKNNRIKSLDYTTLAEEMEMGLWMPKADVEEYYIPIERLNDYIEKSKLKEIIDPTPENPISFEIQISEMYKKLEKLVEGE